MKENESWKCINAIEQINNELIEETFEIKYWYDYPVYLLRVLLVALLLVFLSLTKLLISVYQVILAKAR
jgi:hypothetical protein